jgi:hypothetical protein
MISNNVSIEYCICQDKKKNKIFTTRLSYSPQPHSCKNARNILIHPEDGSDRGFQNVGLQTQNAE